METEYEEESETTAPYGVASFFHFCVSNVSERNACGNAVVAESAARNAGDLSAAAIVVGSGKR